MEPKIKPTDLRGILQYIPRFRGNTFVITADGAVVSHTNFANLLLDIAVLNSLDIRVVLVHGAAEQIAELANEQSLKPSNLDGNGITDDATLKLVLAAANGLTHEILEGFTKNALRAANANAVTAQPLAILNGIDHQNTGQVVRIDTELLQTLLSQGITPVIPPLGFDSEGNTFHLSSDSVARFTAVSLQANKLIFVSTEDGLQMEGEIIRQILSTELKNLLTNHPDKIPSAQRSKAQHAAEACESGVPRTQLINGLVTEGLLAEVFSNEGIGTLVYANEYRQIRPAQKTDAANIMRLSHEAMRQNRLAARTEELIESHLDDYFLYEIDDNPIGCVALHHFPDHKTAELAHLYVKTSHTSQGIGRKLVKFAQKHAREQGLTKLITLSTQSFAYFENKFGFKEGTSADLPPARHELYKSQSRNSKILIKNLT